MAPPDVITENNGVNNVSVATIPKVSIQMFVVQETLNLVNDLES